MSQDLQKINLRLDAHSVRLEVERDKEEFYRQAAVILNQRYQFYQRNMPRASAEQLWVYVALDMGVNLCSDARDKSLQPIEDKVCELNGQLAEVLAVQTN